MFPNDNADLLPSQSPPCDDASGGDDVSHALLSVQVFQEFGIKPPFLLSALYLRLHTSSVALIDA